ncbi:HDOD domain-containing protein [Neobacillus sp. PS3-34]|uniref:EAL and HDOD domain-containing protein n=1 Tax=Neobacillus sp. PS3-34 TaxID=3070678 RepID=UPI0027DFDD6E|nr:HDOD domain-containing protein [Neobacillus sp. PS3-34]WML47886.1 HDOD domain-containing protein [Neobacillus sp. PS3-34]
MEVFVARQPIFTEKEDVFAYELLYRNNQVNQFPQIDGDKATADVIINSFLNIGIDELSNGKPCFINFTDNLLKVKLPTFFHPKEIVIEILESVEISAELIQICKELKELGYQIVLDDFVLNEQNPYLSRLLPCIDIIKVDFQNTSVLMREKIESLAKKMKIKLLAEKIETREEFSEAASSGYQYFQGYFFSKPVIVSSKDIPVNIHSYYEIINLLSADEPSVDKITKLIEQDLSLSYKLLKLINSPSYRPRQKISSIRQAIVLLGLIEIQKWIFVLAVRETKGVKKDLSKEMVSMSLTRAKMSESIAIQLQRFTEASSYFMTGMFSLMDTLLNMPMEKVLNDLPLQENICEALNGQSNEYKKVLDLTIAVEMGNWEMASQLCKHLNIPEESAFHSYHQSIKWAKQIIEMDTSL